LFAVYREVIFPKSKANYLIYISGTILWALKESFRTLPPLRSIKISFSTYLSSLQKYFKLISTELSGDILQLIGSHSINSGKFSVITRKTAEDFP